MQVAENHVIAELFVCEPLFFHSDIQRFLTLDSHE